MGDIIDLAYFYSEQGADELVFYDITASPEERDVSYQWVLDIAKKINIPFCVGGGIRSLSIANKILNNGADKISINTPATSNPSLISDLANRFGSQCVVIGIDSKLIDSDYLIYKNTGIPDKASTAGLKTMDWIKEVINRGAGEIVLNCIQSDGTKKGYDIDQLKLARELCSVPLIASGGAGKTEHFLEVFSQCNVDGALAASVFHKKEIFISDLKDYLDTHGILVRR